MRAFHDSTSNGSLPKYIDIDFFFEVSRSLVALRSQYPRLRDVNGWRLDNDSAQEVVMRVRPAARLWHRTGTEVVLTRKGICVRYSGSRAGSQPVHLQPKRPYPVPRTYYLGEDEDGY